MSHHHTDNYVRCHRAVQLVCSASIPCMQAALDNWHQQKQRTLVACSTPQTCLNKGKPKAGKGSCQPCVAWGNAIETVTYPPNSSGCIAWSNINPTRLHGDPIEVAKAFVLRLCPGQMYNRLGDFDAASVLMMMMRFREFHQGNQSFYDAIKKISDLRNSLSHMKLANNLTIEERRLVDNFGDLEDCVAYMHAWYPLYISQDVKTKLLADLHDIRSSPVTQALKDEVLKPLTTAMENVVRETIQDVLSSENKKTLKSEVVTSTDADHFFSVDLCRKELSEVYKEDMANISLFPFDIDSMVNIDDIFVNVELLEHVQKPDNVDKIKLRSSNDLFCLKRKRVLVKGGPGSGKTTLTKRIAYVWSEADVRSSAVLGKIKLLFCLNMRNLEPDMSLVDAVFDQLLPSDSQITKQGLEHYIKTNPSEIAIVLDGADEFAGNIVKSQQGNLIVDIICNRMLRESIVVVTSRPHKVKEFTQYVHVESTGFSEEGKREFVLRFFDVNTENENVDNEKEESVRKFFRTICKSKPLDSMSCIPVVLTMLCLLWRETQNLPKRITEVYQEAIHYFTQRWLEKQAHDIESDEMEKNMMASLGKVALTGLFEDRLHFRSNEFDLKDTLVKACNIGILSEDRIRSKLHITKYYTFFHKSFQEFCGASYWVSLARSFPSEFESYLNRINIRNFLSFEYILLFCCGLDNTAAKCILLKLTEILDWHCEGNNCTCLVMFPNENWIFMLKLLFESNSQKLAELMVPLFRAKRVDVSINSYDHREAFLFIDYFNECLKMFTINADLCIRNIPITEIKVEILSKTLISVNREKESAIESNRTGRLDPKEYLKEVADSLERHHIQTDILRTSSLLLCLIMLSPNSLITIAINSMADKTLEMAARLLRTISRASKPVKKLRIELLEVPGGKLKDLGESMYRLKSLQFLGIFSSGTGDISSLFKGMICSQLNSIECFEIECVNDDHCSLGSIAKFISTQKLLLGLSITLSCNIYFDPSRVPKLLMDWCFNGSRRAQGMFPDQYIERIVKAIRSHELMRISLVGIIIQKCVVFINRFIPHIRILTLHRNGLDNEHCEKLFEVIGKARSLRTLNMRANKIGGSVVMISSSAVYIPVKRATLGGILQKSYGKKYTWLPKALGLGSSWGATNAVRRLSCSLNTMHSLEHLELSWADLIPENVSVLIEGLQFVMCLKTLNLSGNELHGACGDLKNGLIKMKMLSCLHLSSVGLQDTDAIALSGLFQHLPNLTMLDLGSNHMTYKGIYALSRSFVHLYNLSVLSLKNNSVDSLGIMALCYSLKNLPFLSDIDLSNCLVDSLGALLLATSFGFVSNLTIINLSGNTLICPKGIMWLFEGICSLRKLRELALGRIELKYAQCDERLKTCFERFHWKVTGTYIKLRTLRVLNIPDIIDVFAKK